MAGFPRHPDDFSSLFKRPDGVVDAWPPTQLAYLGFYLARLKCATVLNETHYIDRDYIEDLALFHGRSLRSYPNHCQRLHFFSTTFNQERWDAMASAKGDAHERASARLQGGYLGFCVIRPLPASPVGRTVLRTFGGTSEGGMKRAFGAVRDYNVHLGAFRLGIRGLAFQQQDRGVSACATTALWCAIQKTAPMERLAVVSPAAITESASRYFLADGRALPSEGLTIHQVCEATRATGLSPLLIRSVSYEHDRAQLLGYLSSGFAPVLALQSIGGEGHAVCGVGLKLGAVQPPADPKQRYCDAATTVRGLYLHDDRLGPYAAADIFPYTLQQDGKTRVVTGVSIKWPDEGESQLAILLALVIPVPTKLRLTVARMRDLGTSIADAVALAMPRFTRKVTLHCHFETGVDYLGRAPRYGLTGAGLRQLTSRTVLSRYLGVIRLTVGEETLLDVLLDTTESGSNPPVVACVARMRVRPKEFLILEFFATKLAADFIR